jgi:hypothetical protein
MSTRNLSEVKGRLALKAKRLTAINEPIECGSLDVLQPYGFPWLVTRITLLFKKECSRYRSWLRRYATSRKVAGSISDEVIIYFH